MVRPPVLAGAGNSIDLFAVTRAECRSLNSMIDSPLVRGAVEEAAAKNIYAGEILMMVVKIVAWLKGVEKLDSPSDYQPIAGAARSVFEIATDLTLFAFDHELYSMPKFRAWHESAKLDYAEKLHAAFPDDDENANLATVIARKGEIQSERNRHWPTKNGKPTQHPQRWTGNNLGVDAEAAQKFAPQHEHFRLYRREIAKLNWSVHGSGTWYSNVPGSDFPALVVLAQRNLVSWALVAAEMALRTPFVNGWSQGTERRFVAGKAAVERAGQVAYMRTPSGQKQCASTASSNSRSSCFRTWDLARPSCSLHVHAGP